MELREKCSFARSELCVRLLHQNVNYQVKGESGRNEYQTADGSSAEQLSDRPPHRCWAVSVSLPCGADVALPCCSVNMWLSITVYCRGDRKIHRFTANQ